MNKNTSNKTGMEIAVIGLAGRFPKSDGISEYWDNLRSGKECITFFNDSELHLSKREEKLIDDPNYVKAKGYLEGKDLFDGKFFGYTQSESEIMEPQMRLFHECVWSALEDAGVDANNDNPIGLYGGASSDTYWKIATKMRSLNDNIQSFSDEQLTNEEFMCTKIAYKLNLKGPAVYVKTACSTSMAAIHIACRGLLTGECKVAVAGGVSMLLPDKKGYLYREGMIFSPDGHCRAFDDDAHGTVGGEGAGAVVLKRLKDAESDGDRIYAVIKGSAMNNDGAERVGYTAPGIIGQSTVIKKVYRIAKVDPETVTYVEAHGTGTEVGDPIEVEALKEAFSTQKRNFCGLGSVKSNIGHLDSASGVAGFIKCVLSLYNGILPPTINYKKPNKKIDFANSPFYVNDTLKKWTSPDGILRAGISSFGMGGTNVHIVMENYDYPEKQHNDDYKLLMFSAKTPDSLYSMLMNWKEYLEKNPAADMSEAAYVLEKKRSRFNVRRSIGCFDSSDALKKLETISCESLKKHTEKDKKIVFLFPGQGNQYVKMCSGLYDRIPKFRSYVDECFEVQKKCGRDLKNIWLNGSDDDLSNTTISQPLIFIMEYSIAKFLIDLGIDPDIVVGYSFGDYAAACIAGVFSLEDALYAINIRAQLMQETERGVMLNVPLNREKCEHYISSIRNISIAIDNCDSCVVAGDVASVEKFEAVLKEDRIMCMRIGVDYGSHSHLMLPIIERYKNAIEKVEFHKNRIPMVSCVTGELFNGDDVVSSEYWSNHLKECVQFHKAMSFLDSLNEKYVLVEVGPGRSLLSIALRSIKKDNLIGAVDTIRIKSRDIPDEKFFYDKLGILYDCGIDLSGEVNKKVDRYDPVILPNYSFERKSFGSKYFTDEFFESKKNNFIDDPQNDQRIYIQNWERTGKISNIKNSGDKWLIFADKSSITDGIISVLSKNNEICASISSNDFDDSEKLITDLFKSGDAYNILYAYGIEENNDPQKIYCDNIFKIANICGATNERLKLHLFILCSNSIEAVGCDLKYPEKAFLKAAGTVIPQEYSNIDAKLIDIDKEEYTEKNKLLYLNDICAELSCNEDKIVAYRRKYRLVPEYREVKYDQDSSCINKKGVYILFGGAGGIGRLVADRLMKKYNAFLILCGRKPDNNDGLPCDNDQIEYYKCDISDASEVESVFEYALKKYGKIDGIFNMAAVADGKLIQMRTPSDSSRVIAPKYVGTNNVVDLCKKHNVKLMVLFSSMSSLAGGIGQAAYCAANSYLDACAYYNENYNDIRTICIDWDRWLHTGISNNIEDVHYKITGNVMEDGLCAEEAVELFEKCMCMGYPHLIAVSQPIETFLNEDRSEQNIEVKNDIVIEKMDRSLLSSELCPAETEDERKLVDLWENILSISPIGINDDFMELGGDSLKAIIMLTKVEQIFNRSVSVAAFLTQPTIKELAESIKKLETVTKKEHSITYFNELDDQTKEYLNKNRERYPFIDAYYLSPMQNIMLSYNIMNRTQGQNVSIFECVIHGNVNIELFKKAWQIIVEETPVLRSSFLWRRLNEPVQLIRETTENNVVFVDLSSTDDQEYNDQLLNIREKEYKKDLNVTDHPLHNMIILKRNQTEYRVIVSYLNSLFDGWSTSILLGKLQKYYIMLLEGKHIKAKNDDHYFAALKMQRDDLISGAKDFWKKEFTGFDFDRSSCFNVNQMGEGSLMSLNSTLDNKITERISEYVRVNKITLNSYFQGCWALLISEYEQSNDILTGYVSSGRDRFNDEMMDCVGLFTNIVPLRTVLDENNSTDEYFISVHKHINNINQNSSVLMAEIAKNVNASQEFFEQVSYNKTLTFINYPVEQEQKLDFYVENVVSETSVYVPLRIYIIVENGITVKINYSNDHTDDRVKTLLHRYIEILENGIEKKTLKELKFKD